MLFRHLAIRVNLLIALILALAIGISTYLTKQNWEQLAVQEAMTRATIMSATVLNSIIVEMNSFRQKDVQKIIANVGLVPGIATCRVFDGAGNITYSADPEELGRLVNKIDFSVYKSNKGSRLFKSEGSGPFSFCMVQPIENAADCRRCHGHRNQVLGVLDVCVSMAETQQRIKQNSHFLFASTFTTLMLLVVAISISLWFLVNVPVNRMVKTMARAEKGNLKARAKITRQDELGRLAQSLNSMLKQLDRSDQELKRLHAEQLERADRLATLGELAAGIAHEIKNPLAGIAGATQVLAREFTDDDPRQPVTREILKLIQRLDTTIRDLLDFARPSKPSIISTDLREILSRTLFLAERMPEIKRQGVEVVKDFSPEVVNIPVDPDLIRQAFLNLTVNAIQAMSEGGTLTVTMRPYADRELAEVQPADDYLMVSFRDTGPGINADALRNIFTPFFTTKTQGTGLGLPITMRIVEQHGGRITVQSTPGEGTVFRVYLPKEQRETGTRGYDDTKTRRG